ncbi:MAG: patatin-like phospholipase family protein [Candidatus Cloacimonadales bacterium]|nr:patatin-like phospholipase family protein [Candidatus Cloacimonadales bacterium]
MNKIKIFFALAILSFTLIFAEEMQQRPKIGLTLSGGGARGIAHIGVLKVLEEAGIKVDYITGTSMGSIIGGLYAIGYSPAEMEKIILAQNWDEILLDEISLRNISIEEKEDWGKYIGSFPIEKGKINLPVGLVAGQQVYSFINKLCLSVHHVENFSDLPIPFLCIATDIEKGTEVVLKSGFLPDAIRASMSIPSVFAPIEIDGQLLVDGGLVRNFPVSDALNMGADIVIGVDVGIPLYAKKDLNSLVRILNQAMTFQSVESNKYERELCNILIEPAVNDYSIMDFNKAAALIALGEEAGREMLPELLKLRDKMNQYPDPPEVIPLTNIEEIYIKRIYVQGLRKVSMNLVLGKLGFTKERWIKTSNLQQAIERVYGSQYFEKVSYKLEPDQNGVDLFVRVVEKSSSNLNFGFHYDSDMDAGVLIDATFRNKLIMGSKLSIGAKLSENSAYKMSYFVHTGWKPGFGFEISMKGKDFTVPIYNEDREKVDIYNYSTSYSAFDISTIFSNDFTIGAGLGFENNNVRPEIIQGSFDYQQFFYRFYWLINTYDRTTYPRKGVDLLCRMQKTIEIGNSLNLDRSPTTTYQFQMTVVDKFSDKLVYTESVCLGSLKGAEMQDDSFFYLGGLHQPEVNIIPFVGYKFMSLSAENVAVFSSALRYEIKNNFYTTITGNWAKIGSSLDGLINSNQIYQGYAASLGLMTPIGPLEVTASGGDETEKLLYSVNIGYYF